MSTSICVPTFYAGKSVFITGATGFLGKVLVEKLLRCCPDIKIIYLLLRPKRGQDVNGRLQEIINCKLFDKLRHTSPESFKKLCIIPGDILEDKIGISAQNWNTLQNDCNIIFHSAACVRFNMPIRDAVTLNVRGTQKMLEFAKKMEKLEVFVHVSTAYCHTHTTTLEEKLYPTKIKAQYIINAAGWMDDELLHQLEPRVIKPEPNTYSYTKSLSEVVVSGYAGMFPIAIARPAIVTSSLKEPMPGWVDNFNGPSGIIAGVSKGVCRLMYCDESTPAHVVPVDIVVNACILLSYKTALERSKDVVVCNITHDENNIPTWRECIHHTMQAIEEYPPSISLWYPYASGTTSKLYYLFVIFFLQILPAYCIDFILYLCGRKPFLVQVQDKIRAGAVMLKAYTMKCWSFDNKVYNALRKNITAHDDEIFFTDLREINWKDYTYDFVKGTREYVLKEDPSTLLQARKNYKRLYYLHKVTVFILRCLLLYIVINLYINYAN